MYSSFMPMIRRTNSCWDGLRSLIASANLSTSGRASASAALWALMPLFASAAAAAASLTALA